MGTMKDDAGGYRLLPYPRMRQLVMDAGWMSQRRHMIHGLIEVDITEARRLMSAYKTRTGERLSFTAFAAVCLGRAVDEEKLVHAYRDWRNRLVVFDDVDVLIAIEVKAGDRTFPLVHPLRRVNSRKLYDVHHEIRALQADPERQVRAQSPVLRWFYYAPTFVRHLIYRMVERNPHWRKQYSGTVGLTSVGMFGRGSGWGLSLPNHSLAVVLGGMAEKPGVVNGKIAIREYLNVTVSFDHDVIDGAPAARFSQTLKELLESGYSLTEVGRG